MNNIVFFNYHGKELRTVEQKGELWWVLADVCRVLELSNPRITAERLDDDERRKFDLPRQGETWLVNESGLYSVILRSDKPQAKPFRRWITHEVIPSIRRTGCYRMPTKPASEKYWYGERVLTVADVADMLGMNIRTAQNYINNSFRDGLDRFTLRGDSLRRYKWQNGMESSCVNSITLIRAEVFYDLKNRIG